MMMLMMMMMPEARRQGFGLEQGLLLSGTQDLRHPHYIEPELEPEPEPELEPEPEPEHGS